MEEFKLDFNTLFSYHKQEVSEELTYLTLIYTIILGILGYIGAARKIEPQVRIFISVIFTIFLINILFALNNSLKIHNALHDEIKSVIALHPGAFANGEKSRLYIELSQEGEVYSSVQILWMGIGLWIAVVLGTLTIGEGKVFSFQRLIRPKKRNKRVNSSISS
jgi:hypothetical protein